MSGPLVGLKILDLTRLLPGPLATSLLVSMGAEVLRIKRKGDVDLLEVLPPLDGQGQSLADKLINGGKQVRVIDYKSQEGRDQLFKLVADYDILCEGFRPGAMARWGLDYQAMRPWNPRLIYASLSGYGQTGPYRDRAGHDINYQALAGMASYNGCQGRVHESGFQVADVAGGSCPLVMAILAAVIERSRTGLGQWIDIAMTDMTYFLNHFYLASSLGGEQSQAGRTLLGGGSFYGIYPTSDGRFMAVGSLEPKFARELLASLQLESLMAMVYSRLDEDQARLKKALTQAFRQETQAHWVTLFAEKDCCVEPILTLEEAQQSPLARERDWLNDVSQRFCPIKFHHDREASS